MGGREEWLWRKRKFTIKKLAVKELIGGCTLREKNEDWNLFRFTNNDKVKNVIQVVMFAKIVIFIIIYLKT